MSVRQYKGALSHLWYTYYDTGQLRTRDIHTWYRAFGDGLSWLGFEPWPSVCGANVLPLDHRGRHLLTRDLSCNKSYKDYEIKSRTITDPWAHQRWDHVPLYSVTDIVVVYFISKRNVIWDPRFSRITSDRPVVFLSGIGCLVGWEPLTCANVFNI